MSTRPQSTRSFIGAAISTAASPLRNNFELSCRSPVTPRRPSRHDGRQNGLGIDTESIMHHAYSNSTYLTTPRYLTGASAKAYGQNDDSAADAEEGHGRRSSSSSITLISPTQNDHFLPQTPSASGDHPVKNPSGKLGTFSAINIILGKTVGVGIYSIPASVYVSVGSVGMALLVWVLGALLSFCGLAVYLDLGTAMPRSGGERVYLERIFKRPYMLSTCMFMSYVVLLGFSAPNCIVLGEYVMYALDIEINRWNVRLVAVGVITLLCFIHRACPRTGLRIINVLGVGKMLILAVVIMSGVAGAMLGVGSITSSAELHQTSSTAQRNFSNIFAGSSTQPYDYATALLKVLYCFRGYSTANTVLSSINNPIPTLKLAAPVALSLVSIGYILFASSLFLIVELSDFKKSGITITGHFFRNIFGEVLGERILPCFIIISAFGNIAATSFAQARVNQELGKDGLLPFSDFFARESTVRNGIESSPAPGLFLHWLVSVIVILVPPPGEIYNFLVDIGGYPVSVISVTISGGLLYLQMAPSENYESPFQAKKFYSVVFMLSNCLLLILPWVKPQEKKGNVYIPYWAYPFTALAILGSGALYWCWWANCQKYLGHEQSWIHQQSGTDGLGHALVRTKSYGSDVDVSRSSIDFGNEEGESRELLPQKQSQQHLENNEDGMRKRAPCITALDLLRRRRSRW
ncbi:amino acid transporter-like protein [Coleophoma crateriformis]|uniref:Amino acid transporter-like protein n=1 Tax=Coleophoma crateriformis TaxID=565419 RepID=A0A3D8T3I5_9HELO|nr:amino acid transporter-like protein [Coleophoma crateriformis]